MTLYDFVHPEGDSDAPLLDPDEPHPLDLYNGSGVSEFLLICEHAGRLIPRRLGTLGLDEAELTRHIAWDIGAREIAIALADLLDAPLFMQRYSRLVCDCNRRSEVASYTPEISEATPIPGNLRLTQVDRDSRTAAIFRPFHDAIAAELDRRQAAGIPTALITIHTFTPVFLGVARPWEIGVLFNRDRCFAPAIADWFKANTELTVGVNEPYSVGDDTDYAIPVHGELRGLRCVEFEIRNDLIDSAASALHWAGLIADAITAEITKGPQSLAPYGIGA